LVRSTSVTAKGLSIAREARIEVEVLKQLTRHFVVENGALATQQMGQRAVVRELYGAYHGALTSGHLELFPPRTRDDVEGAVAAGGSATLQARVVCDVVAGMTEAQAVRVHQRMAGIEFGPLLDPAVL
jgi:dGTPase